MSRIISLNFQITPPEKAVVSVMDRSFLYGDSVYEVVRTYRKTTLFDLDRHYDRLCRSATRIQMEIPFSLDELGEHLKECLEKADNLPDSYVRIVVSRGVDDHFSLLPSKVAHPMTVMFVERISPPPPEAYEKGIHAALVSVQRNRPEALDPNIKTGNYMNNMLAMQEAERAGAADAIMLNHENLVTEGTTSNVFMVKGGILSTPEVGSGLLEGITRATLREIFAREKLPFREARISRAEFEAADEIFLTGTIKEILPVTQLSGRLVGDGTVGPMTRKVMDLFRRETSKA